MLTDQERSLRHKARRIYTAARTSGRLVLANDCRRCGATDKLHGHHEDYSEPLIIITLCPSCHGKRHQVLHQKPDEELTKMAYRGGCKYRGEPEPTANAQDAYWERCLDEHRANLADFWNIITAVKDA